VIVLGIDPGTAAMGYGIVEAKSGRVRMVDAGTLVTKPDASLPKRLLAIHGFLDELIALHRPDILAVERLFFSKNAQTAFAVGQARGVVLLAAGQHGLPCASYTPQQVKGAVCGSGRAQKDQVARMVQALLGLPEQPRPDHAADALAVAVCHANCAPLAMALAGASAGAVLGA
jgi:crossover junction endodeoxyribonuclease RuvC